MNWTRILTVFFLLLTPVLAGGYCPYCGQPRAEGWKYCSTCGKALPEQRHTQDRVTGSTRIPMHTTTVQPQRSSSVYQGGGSLFSAPSSSMSSAQFVNQLKGFLGSGTAQQLMGFQNQNISPSQLQELNQNPQVQQLMQQFKNPQFQQQLMQGLKMMPANNGDAQYQGQVGQIENLFRLLNSQRGLTEGASGSSLFQELLAP